MEPVSGRPGGLSSSTAPEVAALRASIACAFVDLDAMIPEKLVWSYKITLRGGHLYHQWELTGERGGIHVHAMWSPSSWTGDRWLGGIEGHSPIPHDYGGADPSHEHCWLIGAPCWHDGSSLQFSEQIAPMLPGKDGAMGDWEHRVVLSEMLSRYNSWLPTAQAIEARRAETGTGSVHESAVPKERAQGVQQ